MFLWHALMNRDDRDRWKVPVHCPLQLISQQIIQEQLLTERTELSNNFSYPEICLSAIPAFGFKEKGTRNCWKTEKRQLLMVLEILLYNRKKGLNYPESMLWYKENLRKARYPHVTCDMVFVKSAITNMNFSES
jgi:hypothetical protein